MGVEIDLDDSTGEATVGNGVVGGSFSSASRLPVPSVVSLRLYAAPCPVAKPRPPAAPRFTQPVAVVPAIFAPSIPRASPTAADPSPFRSTVIIADRLPHSSVEWERGIDGEK